MRTTRRSTEAAPPTTMVPRHPRQLRHRSRLLHSSPTRPPRRSSTARMSRRLHHRRTRLGTIKPVTTRQVATPRATTTTVRISRKSTLPSRRQRCRNMSSPTAPVPTISGRRDIGTGRRPVITGCQVPGSSRPMLEPSGRRDTGDSRAAVMGGTTDTGGHTSAFMAASIMDTATMGPAIRVATGTAAPFITTARLPASITTFATSTRATSATTTAAASAITVGVAD
jgi:hypothetical protein